MNHLAKRVWSGIDDPTPLIEMALEAKVHLCDKKLAARVVPERLEAFLKGWGWIPGEACGGWSGWYYSSSNLDEAYDAPIPVVGDPHYADQILMAIKNIAEDTGESELALLAVLLFTKD